MDIFKNTWFVGISTGIISGLLVYLLTNFIIKKKGKKEYFKQVNVANQSIIDNLKPYVSEQGLPNILIFNSLVVSTARKYSVKVEDMYSVKDFCEELIREIISDVYVSSDKKRQYSDSLVSYMSSIEDMRKESNNSLVEERSYYSPKFEKVITTCFSIIIAVITMISAIVITYDHSFWYPFDDNPLLWIPILILLVILLTMVIVHLASSISKKNKKSESFIEKTKNDQ